MIEKIQKLIKQQQENTIQLRRYFHANPELGMEETNTSERIKQELDRIGIPYKTIAKTGVIATIVGGASGKTVALRADMDALPIQEMNDVDYKSKNDGVCHACGHDTHIASLLGAAAVLNSLKHEIAGTIKLIFQPAEELLKGANLVLEEGGLDDVDGIFGIHLISDIPCGQFSIGYGARMSSADYFKIKIIGEGGHGGFPHLAVDPIMISAAVVTNLQTIVSREVSPQDPVVVSIGKLNAGTKSNIIPAYASLEGTIRAYSQKVREEVPLSVERIAANIAKAHKGSIEYKYIVGAPPTVNEDSCVNVARNAAKSMYGESCLFDYPPVTGAEDFALYLEKMKGVFVFVGCGNPEKDACYPLHSEHYNVDEDALAYASSLYVKFAIDFLNI